MQGVKARTTGTVIEVLDSLVLAVSEEDSVSEVELANSADVVELSAAVSVDVSTVTDVVSESEVLDSGAVVVPVT